MLEAFEAASGLQVACKLLLVVSDHIEMYPSSVAAEGDICALACDGPDWGPMADRVLASGGANMTSSVLGPI